MSFFSKVINLLKPKEPTPNSVFIQEMDASSSPALSGGDQEREAAIQAEEDLRISPNN
jgi:hypothetical protein